MHKLKELKQQIIEELEARSEKGISSMNDLKEIDCLAHAGKNLGKLIEMCEEEESGSSFRMMPYSRRSYYDREGSSYRRRRDSMGRYARDGRSYDDGYAEASGEMHATLETMLRNAKSEEERRTIERMMDEIKN